MSTAELSEDTVLKLEIVKDELGAPTIDQAMNKSLEIAHFVTRVINDPKSKLLVERNGKFEWIKKF